MPDPFLAAVQLAAISGAVVALFLIARLIQSRMLHTTLRKAIESDPASAMRLMDRIDQRTRDGRNGLVLFALGIALCGFGLIMNSGATRIILGASLFPTLLGAALMVWAQLARRTRGE